MTIRNLIWASPVDVRRHNDPESAASSLIVAVPYYSEEDVVVPADQVRLQPAFTESAAADHKLDVEAKVVVPVK